MKKWLIASLLAFFLILVILVVVLLIRFSSLYQEARGTESTAIVYAVEDYAAQTLTDYESWEYDAATQTLTLKRSASLSYEEACSFGGNIYTEELAPETYLSSVQSIALDVAANCNRSSLTVVLCYLSSDGEPIFTVSSNNELWTCWKKP